MESQITIDDMQKEGYAKGIMAEESSPSAPIPHLIFHLSFINISASCFIINSLKLFIKLIHSCRVINRISAHPTCKAVIIFIHLHSRMSVIMERTTGSAISTNMQSITFCHLSCGSSALLFPILPALWHGLDCNS